MGEIVWRHYDQEQVNQQLNLRARTPEHADHFARWAEEGRRVRAEFPGARLDLQYGSTPPEALDYFPAATPDAPLIVFIHGGYWQSLDKADFDSFAWAWREAGFAYASLNYTLAPAARVPEMVQQVRRALIYLYESSEGLGFDRTRTVVSGHSAGAHLAVMAGITDWSVHGLPTDFPKAVVSVSGLYELELLLHSYQQPVLQIDAAQVAEISPQRLIGSLPTGSAPALLCAVGSTEPEEFQEQQKLFLDAWTARGLSGEGLTLEGDHHFNVVERLGRPGDPLFERMAALALG
ncbi:alpha/beta hydrolase [Algihabitans albus]|uniref:alpha/beta hydrolase n=1 Tax=Algihabitans albus TaxID=2164067 RepID=UPI0013C2B919|nr:alpha/beta hydrolase [Algihabitans albus]